MKSHTPTGPWTDSTLPAWQRVLRLATPVFLQQMLILIINLSDRWLAGHSPSDDPAEQIATQAAQTTGFYLAWFVSCYAALVSVGSTALVARFVGAGEKEAARRVLHQSVWLAGLFGVVGSIAGWWWLRDLVHLLNLKGQTAEFAVEYLRPVVVFLPFQLVGGAILACLVGAGDTRTGFFLLSGLTIINLPLAWSFFHGWWIFPRLGFGGISLGTCVGHMLGSLFLLGLLFWGRAGLKWSLDHLRPDLRMAWRILRIGVPVAADTLSVAVGQLFFLERVNRLSDAEIGAHGIALGWEALGYLSGYAFGTAAMTLVGQNLGAHQPREARRCGWVSLGLGALVMSTMGLIFFAFARPMFLLFCPMEGQGAIVEAGVPVLRLVAFAMPALASCIVLTQALRGAGDTLVPVLITLFGFFVVRLPLAAWLTGQTQEIPLWGQVSLGLMGAWMAMFVDLLVRGSLVTWRFAQGNWARIKI